jgi:hypothetical protein
MIKSAKDVIAVVKERKLKLRVDPGPPPMPILTRPQGVPLDAVTPILLDALRAWRLEIIQELEAPPIPEEWAGLINPPGALCPRCQSPIGGMAFCDKCKGPTCKACRGEPGEPRHCWNCDVRSK